MLAIIGCGNLARSDDGAGVEVVHRLMKRTPKRPDDLRFVDAGTAGMEVMYQIRGADRVVIVDACRSGSEPGAVFRLPGSEAQTRGEPGFTLHGVRWDHALYAGSRMFGENFASGTEVFLIEAQSLDFGIGLSDPVIGAVERVVCEIEKLIDASSDKACAEVWLHQGRLHLTEAAYRRHLDGCVAVGLLARDDEWLMLPLRAGAGGLQIKLRNARGDRVIEAQEFFRTHGREDSQQIQALCLSEDPQRGELRITFAQGNAE